MVSCCLPAYQFLKTSRPQAVACARMASYEYLFSMAFIGQGVLSCVCGNLK